MAQTLSDNGLTYGATAAAHGLFSIGASVAANALTVTLDPTTIAFRSTTLTSGTPAVVQNAAQLSLTVPSGATLGTVNATQSDIYLLALNNAGTMELAVVNISGGVSLDETGLISTTAISAAATSASVIYSASARTNVAYKVVGVIRSTQATAGTWASAPSLVQGAGGNALDSLGSLGYGQTWQTVTRTSGTTYYNTTGKPIVCIPVINAATGYTITVGGATAISGVTNSVTIPVPFVVPAGMSYVITAGSGISSTTELR